MLVWSINYPPLYVFRRRERLGFGFTDSQRYFGSWRTRKNKTSLLNERAIMTLLLSKFNTLRCDARSFGWTKLEYQTQEPTRFLASTLRRVILRSPEEHIILTSKSRNVHHTLYASVRFESLAGSTNKNECTCTTPKKR